MLGASFYTQNQWRMHQIGIRYSAEPWIMELTQLSPNPRQVFSTIYTSKPN